MRRIFKPSRSRWGLLSAFIVFLIFLSGDIVVSAKESDFSEAGYSAVLYDNSNGLPTSEANAVAQTKDGFVWIGGYSGLIRYDGNDFYRFDSSTGITNVMSLYVDSEDRLWIGTNDNGAALYDNGEFRFFGRDEGLLSLSVRSIAEDADGNILLATTRGLAYIDDSFALHMLEDGQISQKYICILRTDADGVVYGCTLDGAFFSIERLALTDCYDSKEMGISTVCTICPDPKEKGKVYLGTEGSEILWGEMSGGMEGVKKISVHPQTNINFLLPDDEGLLWVCADNGIGYLNERKYYRELSSIPMNNSIDRMMFDYEGNLWFTSSRQGVMKVVSTPFTDISSRVGLEPAVVNTTCFYQGNLYIGTDTGLQLVNQYDRPKENVLTRLLRGVRVRCIKEDSDGNLWLCTYSENGLVCYHGDGTYTIYNEENGLGSNRVRVVTQMSDGTIVVSTSGGINLIRDGSIISAYDEEDAILNTEILTLCEGEDGSLYMGSDGDGIYVLKDETISRLGLEDGLKSEIVLRIKKDTKRDLYWIITSNSISYMKDGSITTLSNFPYGNNFDMYFDDKDGIWILSSNGIYVVNGEQLLKDKKPDYTFYDMRNGLPCVATANSRSAITDDGTLYMAGVQGVSSININQMQELKGDVKLTVPFLDLDDKTIMVEEGETIRIPAGCKRLTIHGYALTYSLQNPRLKYYLEGFDEEAFSVSKQDMQPVSYTNLDSGEYIFHLSIINTMTGEEEQSIAVTIIKEKAVYERGWFWVLILIAAILVILFGAAVYVHEKTAKLLKKQEEDDIFIDQMIQAFAKSIDLKDKYTNGHSFRVAKYTKMIAEKLGYSPSEAAAVYNIGLLHDIGKITIPDEILNKPGRLTDEEFAIMKQHSINGYDILKEIEAAPELALGAGYHHERIDGRGYPFGKKAGEIPPVAQMIAVADTFDAMHSTRPYREQMKMEDIVTELKRVSGTQLNEEFVKVLLELIEEGKV
ncbi:MAG: HD domain-containing protein [Blautia sp.]|nr:HD domain-containing protein [Lachnoclostridium sp.]MCM1211131.1 HD domain-containing protein [Blautia sp.]